MPFLKHTLFETGINVGISRPMPGRASDQMVQTVLHNFLYFSFRREEGICIFYRAYKFKVSSALKLFLLLRTLRTDLQLKKIFSQGSCSFTSYSKPSALLLEPVCSFLLIFSHSEKALKAINSFAKKFQNSN